HPRLDDAALDVLPDALDVLRLRRLRALSGLRQVVARVVAQEDAVEVLVEPPRVLPVLLDERDRRMAGRLELHAAPPDLEDLHARAERDDRALQVVDVA